MNHEHASLRARYATALFDVAITESTPEQVGAGADSLRRSRARSRRVPERARQPSGAAGRASAAWSRSSRPRCSCPRRSGSSCCCWRNAIGSSCCPTRGRLSRARDGAPEDRAGGGHHRRADSGASRPRSWQQRLGRSLGRTVTMTTKVDPALIGGMVTRIGGTVYDGSVATQLARPAAAVDTVTVGQVPRATTSRVSATRRGLQMDIRAEEISKIIRDQIGSYAVAGRRRRSRHRHFDRRRHRPRPWRRARHGRRDARVSRRACSASR